MTVYKVKAVVFVEASSAGDASATALGDGPGTIVLREAEYPEELPPERGAAILEFAAHLKMAASYKPEEYVEDPQHPGVRLSPAAAATLRRLEDEAR